MKCIPVGFRVSSIFLKFIRKIGFSVFPATASYLVTESPIFLPVFSETSLMAFLCALFRVLIIRSTELSNHGCVCFRSLFLLIGKWESINDLNKHSQAEYMSSTSSKNSRKV